MRKLVYISAPFTATSPEIEQANIARAVEMGRQVRTLNASPLIPHTSVLQPQHRDAEVIWSEAMQDCLCLLAHCDVMLLLPGWESSRGCRLELLQAEEWGIPVYHSLRDLQAAIERAA